MGLFYFNFFLVVIVTCYNLSPAIRRVWRLWLPLFHGRGKHMLNYYLFCIPEDEKMKILMIWRWTPLSPEPAQFIVCDFQILSVQRGLCNPSILFPIKIHKRQDKSLREHCFLFVCFVCRRGIEPSFTWRIFFTFSLGPELWALGTYCSAHCEYGHAWPGCVEQSLIWNLFEAQSIHAYLPTLLQYCYDNQLL